MPPDRSFMRTVRQPDVEDGRTHASTVMPVVSRRPGASGTLTCPVPAKLSAPPYFEVVVRVTPVPSVPVLPLPVASVTVVPAVSLKPHAAIGSGRVLLTVTFTGAAVTV